MDSHHSAWQIWARFKFLPHGDERCSHKIYWNPPDIQGRSDVYSDRSPNWGLIHPRVILPDYDAEYTVHAVFIHCIFTAVKFEVSTELPCVWTIVRCRDKKLAFISEQGIPVKEEQRRDEWWAFVSEQGIPVKEYQVNEEEPVKKEQGIQVNLEQEGDDEEPVKEEQGIQNNSSNRAF